MRRVKSSLSDSDNKAISVQVQLGLDLPTGTELGNRYEGGGGPQTSDFPQIQENYGLFPLFVELQS